jgi:AcrR family transcriptional regulator
MEQLAAEVGISRATLYRRVGSKEDLLRRLVRERGLEVDALEGRDVPGRILEAARIAFGKNGLARTTMEQVAAEAGLGVATLYRQFGDRDGLIRAFLDRYTPRRAFQEVAAVGSGDVRADLTRLVSEMLVFLHKNRDMIWLGLSEGEETQRLLGRLYDAPQGARKEIVRFLEAAMEAGQLEVGDPEQMATALGGMLMAFALEIPVFGGRPLTDPRRTAEFIVHVFVEGMERSVDKSEGER